MKQNILSFLALLGVILTFSCNNTITPETIQTQKVILLYGNYSLINNNTLIELSDGANKLQIPVSALLDGKALFGDAIKNKLADFALVFGLKKMVRIERAIGAVATLDLVANGAGQILIFKPMNCGRATGASKQTLP